MFNLIKRGTAQLRSLFFLIIFPKKCLGCGAFDSYFCVACQSKLRYLLDKEYKGELLVYSIFSYKEKGVAPLIHGFKYGALRELFAELRNILAKERESLQAFLPRGRFYYLSVPLHRKRLRERGFNQSDELAKIWQDIWPGEILENVIFRQKYNKAQAKLGRQERLQNLKGKFVLGNFDFSKINKDDYLILVDDVLTTGSTLNEVFVLLKNKWPGKIIGLTLARD